MPFWTILGTWWVFSIFLYLRLNQPGEILAVVESLTKTVKTVSALLDHFRDMVGVFPHRLYAVGVLITLLRG